MTKTQAAEILDLVIDRAPKLRNAGVVLREFVVDGVTIRLDAAPAEIGNDAPSEKQPRHTIWDDEDLGLADPNKPKRKET